MTSEMASVRIVKEMDNLAGVNNYLSQGWILLTVSTRGEGGTQYPVYILGWTKPLDPSMR